MSSTLRWKKRPEGSNWGDFGSDDQLGRMNLITVEKRKQGLAEATDGIAFCLSLPLDYPGGTGLNPRRHPPVLRPTLRGAHPNFIYALSNDNPDFTDVINDDAVILHTQYSTQWDALCHVGYFFDADDDGVAECVFYNGYRTPEHIQGPEALHDAGAIGTFEARSTSVARTLGIEGMAATCVQGRAVMIDLHAHFGREPVAVNYDTLMRIMTNDGVAVESGDMVCLHTGLGQLILDMGKSPDPQLIRRSCPGLDGSDPKLLEWITRSGLSALISDNIAVELLPVAHHGHGASMPIHEHCLFKLGVHLGEIWYLTPLAAYLRSRRRSRFLLTAPPLRLPGAVGSPVTGVATV